MAPSQVTNIFARLEAPRGAGAVSLSATMNNNVVPSGATCQHSKPTGLSSVDLPTTPSPHSILVALLWCSCRRLGSCTPAVCHLQERLKPNFLLHKSIGTGKGAPREVSAFGWCSVRNKCGVDGGTLQGIVKT